jgi:4-hydroxy-tetrahydrodipicolinate synthase
VETGFLSGVMAALVTPLREDGTLDTDGLARLVETVAGGGADGISPAGSTGEGALLTREQRLTLTARVRQLAPPGMPVIPGVPLVTVADGPPELEALAAAGATAALVAPPAYYPLSDDGVLRMYQALADAAPLPLVLYNIPVFTKVRLSPAVVARLAAHPAIIGIKDSSRDMEYQQQLIMATGEADFSVLTGTDTLLVASLALGAAGAIAASANLVPDLASGIYHAFEAGDMTTAVRLQQRLARIVAACRRGYFPAGWKAALEIADVCQRHPAPGGTPLSPEEFGQLRSELAAAGIGG